MSERELGIEILNKPKKETTEPLVKLPDRTQGYGEQISQELFAAQHVILAKGQKKSSKKNVSKQPQGIVFDASDE